MRRSTLRIRQTPTNLRASADRSASPSLAGVGGDGGISSSFASNRSVRTSRQLPANRSWMLSLEAAATAGAAVVVSGGGAPWHATDATRATDPTNAITILAMGPPGEKSAMARSYANRPEGHRPFTG